MQKNVLEKQELGIGELYFDPEFFADEVRNGFFVSEMMKRFWAAQLVVLNEIDKLCRRHDISWFADMGTLLGAIRHGGFVPWDDDLDISMMRHDYENFFKYANDELPQGYMALTVDNNVEYNMALGRVTNGRTISMDGEYLGKFCGCPYVVGVDIFPIDNIYDDTDKENGRKKREKDIYHVSNLISNGKLNTPQTKMLLSKIQKDNKAKFHKNGNITHELAVLLDRISGECQDMTREAAFMYPWVMSDRMNCDREIFTNITASSFENIRIRIPENYDELLTKEYGDYMAIYKGGGVHQYPVYKDYESLLREKLGHNPFRYTLDVELVRERMLNTAKRKASFAAANAVNHDIVFMPCKEQWWGCMKPAYDEAIRSRGNDTYVIPIPYFDCDYTGTVGQVHFDREWANELIGVTDFDNYNLVKRHPSKIVIQVPYDSFSTTMTVHERLYSDRLLQYTDELIYIPYFDVDPPTGDDDKAISAMRPIIEQPVVVNADRIVLNSEELKTLYVETLVSLTGEDTRSYWDEKIGLLADVDW